VFEKVVDGEADVQLLIKLPELKTLVAQNLVFNNMHHFIPRRTRMPARDEAPG
jgi:hypothetical protein